MSKDYRHGGQGGGSGQGGFSKRGFIRNQNMRKATTQSRRHTRGESLDTGGGGLMKNWTPMREAVARAPCCPGIFKIGLAHDSYIEVVYIGSSSSQRTLREIITSIVYGFEGGERLAMMVVCGGNRKKLMIQWITSVYPEELIEDELEEFIATNHRIPEYNTPIDPNKGLYVVVDCHIPKDPRDNVYPGEASGGEVEQTPQTNYSVGTVGGHLQQKVKKFCCPSAAGGQQVGETADERILRFKMCNVRIY